VGSVAPHNVLGVNVLHVIVDMILSVDTLFLSVTTGRAKREKKD
jgi:hypothetical protein